MDTNHDEEIKCLKFELEGALKEKEKFQKGYDDMVKILIPKMIEECAKYFDERDATNKALEQSVAKQKEEI